jgi:hypothetical protein
VNSRRMGGVVLVALTLAASLASAQETRGRIQGIVLDPSRASLADAKVTLRNDGSGVATSRQTSRNGRYLFDYVDPGQYTLVFEMAGFKRLEQKNVLVQQRGDVTVDATLQMGEMSEVVTVAESPVAVQFNTASRDLTIDQQMLRDLPSITGNPFQMALLDPSVVNRGSGETQPYFHRAANELDYGGGTKYRNDMLLDGTPLVAGNKLGYTPPSDAVTEYTVAQNAVDAEFGHSGGGIVLVTMKSGSNDLHGSAYYFGRNPDWNAVTNRVSTPRAHSQNPYHRAGGTAGFPLRRNKVFMFAVFETMINTNTVDRYYTLPTALERQGDFSQSKTATGALRVIYNPFTTVRVGNNYTRQAFPGNRIPSDLWDPVAKRIMDSLWNAKNAGQDPSGTRNFTYLEEDKFHYYNFSTRLDWQINDQWKAWARLSRLKTDQDMPDFTKEWGGDPLKARSNTGSKRNGWNVAAARRLLPGRRQA